MSLAGTSPTLGNGQYVHFQVEYIALTKPVLFLISALFLTSPNTTRFTLNSTPLQ